MTITIKLDSFTGVIRDADAFLDRPIGWTRKIWKVIFADPSLNEQAIRTIQDWLPEKLGEIEAQIGGLENSLAEARAGAESKRRETAAWGSALGSQIRQAKAGMRRAQRMADADGTPLAKARLGKAERELDTLMQIKTGPEEAAKEAKRIGRRLRQAEGQYAKMKKLTRMCNDFSDRAKENK